MHRTFSPAAAAGTLVLPLCLAVIAWAQGFPGGHSDVWGPHYDAAARSAAARAGSALAANPVNSPVRYWNQIAIDASGLDHTPIAPGEQRTFGEQLGPGRASRAIALVHIATFEAVNAIHGGYRSYTGLPRAQPGASMAVAVGQAAHDTLVTMFPSQKATFDSRLAEQLARIRAGRPKSLGIAVGQAAAASILALRASDGAQHPEPKMGTDYVPSDDPGKWRQDPVSQVPLALGAHWAEVRPFVMSSAAQFRVPPPPAMESAGYAAAFEEVKRLGGDGVLTPTERTEDQTLAGL